VVSVDEVLTNESSPAEVNDLTFQVGVNDHIFGFYVVVGLTQVMQLLVRLEDVADDEAGGHFTDACGTEHNVLEQLALETLLEEGQSPRAVDGHHLNHVWRVQSLHLLQNSPLHIQPNGGVQIVLFLYNLLFN